MVTIWLFGSTKVTTYHDISQDMERKKFTISGKRLKAAREAIKPKLSQKAFGEKIGLGRAQVVVWEGSVSRDIDIDQAKMIAKVLGVSLDDLTEVATNNSGRTSDDLEKILETFDRMVASKDDEIKRIERIKNEEIQRLLLDKEFLHKHINDLTQGFASIKNAQ